MSGGVEKGFTYLGANLMQIQDWIMHHNDRSPVEPRRGIGSCGGRGEVGRVAGVVVGGEGGERRSDGGGREEEAVGSDSAV